MSGWLANLERRDEAECAIRKALALAPDAADCAFRGAQTFQRLGLREEALRWLESPATAGP